MLCVANLPTGYSEEQFKALVRTLGKVEESFLVRCEAGLSKGYGFVKYATYESEKIECKLRAISGLSLSCKFFDIHASLQSNCLLVENLPAYLVDMIEFRKVCSAVATPTFCQLGLKQGCVQNWGLVEYHDWKDAEKSQKHLLWNTFKGQGIKVTYCMPGECAFNIMQSLTKPTPKPMSLLMYPSRTEVTEYLIKISKCNDQFAQQIYQMCSNALQTDISEDEKSYLEAFGAKHTSSGASDSQHLEAFDAKRTSSGVHQITSYPMNCIHKVNLSHSLCLQPPKVFPPVSNVLPPTPKYFRPGSSNLPPESTTPKFLHPGSSIMPPEPNVLPSTPKPLHPGSSIVPSGPNVFPSTPKFVRPGSSIVPPVPNFSPPTPEFLPPGASDLPPNELPTTHKFSPTGSLNFRPMPNVLPPASKGSPLASKVFIPTSGILIPDPKYFSFISEVQLSTPEVLLPRPKAVSPRSSRGKVMRFAPYPKPVSQIQHKRHNHTSFPFTIHPLGGFHLFPEQPMPYSPNDDATNTMLEDIRKNSHTLISLPGYPFRPSPPNILRTSLSLRRNVNGNESQPRTTD